jgi:hypothetical protein
MLMMEPNSQHCIANRRIFSEWRSNRAAFIMKAIRATRKFAKVFSRGSASAASPPSMVPTCSLNDETLTLTVTLPTSACSCPIDVVGVASANLTSTMIPPNSLSVHSEPLTASAPIAHGWQAYTIHRLILRAVAHCVSQKYHVSESEAASEPMSGVIASQAASVSPDVSSPSLGSAHTRYLAGMLICEVILPSAFRACSHTVLRLLRRELAPIDVPITTGTMHHLAHEELASVQAVAVQYGIHLELHTRAPSDLAQSIECLRLIGPHVACGRALAAIAVLCDEGADGVQSLSVSDIQGASSSGSTLQSDTVVLETSNLLSVDSSTSDHASFGVSAVRSVLPSAVAAFSDRLPLSMQESVRYPVGTEIVINAGMPTEERNFVVDYGSLVLRYPLQFDHREGERIQATQYTPALDHDIFLFLQQMAEEFYTETCFIEVEIGRSQLTRFWPVPGPHTASLAPAWRRVEAAILRIAESRSIRAQDINRANLFEIIPDSHFSWHGCREDAVPSICYHGFDPTKRSGQLHGTGEYFAAQSSIAQGFCRNYYMLVCFIVHNPDQPCVCSHLMDGGESMDDWAYVVLNPGGAQYFPMLSFSLALGVVSWDRLTHTPPVWIAPTEASSWAPSFVWTWENEWIEELEEMEFRPYTSAVNELLERFFQLWRATGADPRRSEVLIPLERFTDGGPMMYRIDVQLMLQFNTLTRHYRPIKRLTRSEFFEDDPIAAKGDPVGRFYWFVLDEHQNWQILTGKACNALEVAFLQFRTNIEQKHRPWLIFGSMATPGNPEGELFQFDLRQFTLTNIRTQRRRPLCRHE